LRKLPRNEPRNADGKKHEGNHQLITERTPKGLAEALVVCRRACSPTE